jgi:aryl-alcohol dehydrogenase-like predicted oxidoreductase
VHAIAPVTSVQPPYSIVRRDVEHRILPWCREHGVGVIVYSPMQSGLLTGAWTKERLAALPADDWRKEKNRHFQEPLFSRNLRLVELLKQLGGRHGRTPGEVAIAWVLRRPAVTGAIVGARKPGQLKELVGAAEWRLTDGEAGEIERFLRDNPE